MNKDIFTFGQCKECNRCTCLKNGYCQDCDDREEKRNFELPDCFKSLFGGSK